MNPEEIAAKAQADADAAEKAKADADAKAKADAEAAAKQPTAEEIAAEAAAAAQKKSDRTVPEAAFLELKKDNKEMAKAIKDLQKKVSEGASATEVSADIAAIGEEYGVNKDFLGKLAAAIKGQAEHEAAERLKPFEEQQRAASVDAAFQKHFKIAMDKMPEFADIVNAEVIKTLSLLPKNKDKTFSQIIEETYASALTGRRTIDTTKPGGGKEPAPLDFDKARKDSTYFDEVMADPKLKAEYNAKMLEKGF